VIPRAGLAFKTLPVPALATRTRTEMAASALEPRMMKFATTALPLAAIHELAVLVMAEGTSPTTKAATLIAATVPAKVTVHAMVMGKDRTQKEQQQDQGVKTEAGHDEAAQAIHLPHGNNIGIRGFAHNMLKEDRPARTAYGYRFCEISDLRKTASVLS
jgi:hypothetical protein